MNARAVRMAVVAGLAVLVAGGGGGCRVMERISEGAYRHAVLAGTERELADRGVRLARLDCDPPSRVGGDVLHIRCHGRTTDGRPVVTTGTASEIRTAEPREAYVIAVAGRVVVRADCLGPDCS